jgi:hypothetical protein
MVASPVSTAIFTRPRPTTAVTWVMGAFAESVRNAWLTAVTGGVAYSNPELWVQVHIGDPGSAGTDNPAANTQRQRPTWFVSTGGSVSNDASITWIALPASETYTHISLWSLAVGGTLVGTDNLAAPAPVVSGGNFAIGPGILVLSVLS